MRRLFTNGDLSDLALFLAGMLAVAMTLGAIGATRPAPTPNSTTLLSAVSAEGE